MNILKVENLSVTLHLPQRTLFPVRNLSFSIGERQIVGLIGESGCGKSLAARSLLKLLPQSTQLSGSIQYYNQELIHYSEHAMRAVRGKEIGMIFQDPLMALNPTLPIGTQIIETLLHHKIYGKRDEAKAHAIELLSMVGIPLAEERIEAYAHMLSGGQRQRVMIAMALAAKPKLLLADEPTTALDVTVQAQILDLLQTLSHAHNMSVLLITHDISLVARLCDRVLVMYGGQIVEDAPVDLLFASPKHPYTQALFSALPRINRFKDTPLSTIEGSPPILSKPIDYCSFCPRCPYAMELCARQEPDLIERDPNHFVACWHPVRDHDTSF